MGPILLALLAAAVIGLGGVGAYFYGLLPGTYRAALRGLKSKNRRTKIQSANQLARFKNAEAVAPLIRSLKIPDPSVRRACIEALAKIGRSAFEPLCQTFVQPDEELKFAAVEALSSMSPADNLELLAKKLATAPGFMRRYVGEVLARCGPDAIVYVLKYTPDVSPSPDHDNTDAQARRVQFVEVLARLAERNLDLLYQAQATSDKQRLYIAQAMAIQGDPRAAGLLTRLLPTRNPHLRKEAVEALGNLREQAIDALLEVLQGPNEAAKVGVVDLLVSIGGKAMDALADLVRSEDPQIRLQAATALGRLGNIKPLILVLWPKKPAFVARTIENTAKTRLDMLSDQAALKKAIEQALFLGKMSKKYRGLYYLQAILIVLFPGVVDAVEEPRLGKVLAYGGNVVDNAGFLKLTHLHPVARQILARPKRAAKGTGKPTQSAAGKQG